MEKTYYQPLQTITVEASANLTSKRFAKIASSKLAYCGANEKSIGVLAVDVDSGELSPVVTIGTVLVEVGSGGVTENTPVTSDANGKAVAVSALTATPAVGATPVTSTGAQAAMVLAGGVLPVKVNGLSLDTVAEGGFARILLK